MLLNFWDISCRIYTGNSVIKYGNTVVARDGSNVILATEPLDYNLEPVFISSHNNIASYKMYGSTSNYIWVCKKEFLQNERAYKLAADICNTIRVILINGKYFRSHGENHSTWLFLGRDLKRNTILLYEKEYDIPKPDDDHFLAWTIDSKFLLEVQKTILYMWIPLFGYENDQKLDSNLIQVDTTESMLFLHPTYGIVGRNYSGNAEHIELLSKNGIFSWFNLELLLTNIEKDRALFKMIAYPNTPGTIFFSVSSGKSLATTYSNNPYELLLDSKSDYQIVLRKLFWNWDEFEHLSNYADIGFSSCHGLVSIPTAMARSRNIEPLKLIKESLYSPRRKKYLYFYANNYTGIISFEWTENESKSSKCLTMDKKWIFISTDNQEFQLMRLNNNNMILGFKPISKDVSQQIDTVAQIFVISSEPDQKVAIDIEDDIEFIVDEIEELPKHFEDTSNEDDNVVITLSEDNSKEPEHNIIVSHRNSDVRDSTHVQSNFSKISLIENDHDDNIQKDFHEDAPEDIQLDADSVPSNQKSTKLSQEYSDGSKYYPSFDYMLLFLFSSIIIV